MGQESNIIDHEISKLELPGIPENLYGPIEYFLNLGGKRFRPHLVLLANSLYSDEPQKALPAALAIELFHNFTLIHDDIMDKATLRRGKETVHIKWNDNTAILSGDMTLIKAYQQLEKLEPEHKARILHLFNEAAVLVCEGQQMDINFETRNDVSVEEYLNMISLKTAALVEYALLMGAEIGGASDEEKSLIRSFGKNIGIAFQIKDDLLDAFAEDDSFGKKEGGDIIENKKTFLLLKAFEKADEDLTKELKYWIDGYNFNAEEKVAAVKGIFEELEIKEETEQLIRTYTEKAKTALKALKPEYHDHLEELEALTKKLDQRTN